MLHAMSTLTIYAQIIFLVSLTTAQTFRDQNHEFYRRRVANQIQPTPVLPQIQSESQPANGDAPAALGCVFASCCGRLNNCQPKDCSIDTRTCVALGNQGFLANFGQNVFNGLLFAKGSFDVGNLLVQFGDSSQKTKYDSERGVTFASNYGTVTVLQSSVPVYTITVSDAPHVEVSDQILETRGLQTITHRVVLPKNADIDVINRLQCGPITVLNQLVAPARTVWTVITPVTTTVTKSTCNKFVGRTNLYENVPNFHTAPPSAGGGFVNGNNWGDHVRQPWQHVPHQRPNFNQQPFFNRHTNSYQPSPPCYWCPARYNSWQVPPRVGFAPPSPVSLGWYSRPSATSSSSGFGGKRWFSDVAADQQIKNEKTACGALIEQYVESPLQTEQKLVDFVNKTFYGTDESRKKFANGVEPTTFHCCHSKFGEALLHPNATIARVKTSKSSFSTPILPQNVTCASLVDELYKQLRSSSSTIPKDNVKKLKQS